MQPNFLALRKVCCSHFSVIILRRYFEPQITSIFGKYIESMLQKFYTNPSLNWKSKDAAIYLVTSLATRAKTAKHGITQTNQVVII